MTDDTPTQRFDAAREPDDEATRRIEQVAADEVATRRLDQVADAETRRLDAAPPATVPFAPHVPLASLPPENVAFAPAVAAAAAPPLRPRGDARPTAIDRPSRAPMIALIVIGALLVAALAIYLISVASRSDRPAPIAGTSASATPSATPTPTATPSATPTPTPTPTPTVAPEPVVATFTSFTPADGTAVLCDGDTLTTPLEFTWTSDDAERAWIGQGTTNAKNDPTSKVDPSGTYSKFEFSCEVESQVYTVTLESADGELTSQSVTLVRQLAE